MNLDHALCFFSLSERASINQLFRPVAEGRTIIDICSKYPEAFMCLLTALSLTELFIRFLEYGKLRDRIKTLRNAFRNNCVDQRVDFKSQSITHFGFAINRAVLSFC